MNELLAQLQSIAATQPQAPITRFNPRPPGVIRTGSASDDVLKCLRQHGGMMTQSQIRFRTGRTHSQISWALPFLLSQKLIEFRPDPARNSRYRRYRAVPTVLP